MTRLKIAFGLFAMTLMVAAPAIVSPASACTNSSDTARDGSNCGGRASGCKAGGRGGYC